MFRRVALPANTSGGCAAALGGMAACPALTEQNMRDALDLLIERFGRARYHGDLATAIGRLASSPRATTAQRVRATELLGQVLERPAEDETEMRATVTPKGKVYEVTGRVEFDSDTLPAAVAGLTEIAVSSGATPALRRQTAALMLRVWQNVSAWKTVWGPRSSEALAAGLGRIGTDKHTGDEMRAQIIRALSAALERLSVVRALKDIFAVSGDDEAVRHAITEAAEEMLELWIEPEITPDELNMVLTTAATAAGASATPPRVARARKLQQRVAELLFDALRAGHPWSRPALAMMHDSPGISRTLRKDIAERLASAQSIVNM